MKPLFFACFILAGFSAAAQQKPLFTHYMFNHFFYNPAVAAATDGAELNALYRKQWAGLDGGPKTGSFSGFGAIKGLNLGLGGTLFFDKTGPLSNTGFNFSASYGIHFSNQGILSAGIGAGIIHYDLNNNFLIRETNDIAVVEAQDGKIIPDASIGIYYALKGFYAGFSIPQLFESDVKLKINDPRNMNKLVRHYFVITGYRFSIAENFELEPSAQLKAVKSADVQIDFTTRAIYKKMLWLGLAYRSSDAVNVLVGYSWKESIEVGYAYDITTSNLSDESNGSHEVFVRYRFKKSKPQSESGIQGSKY